MDISLLQADELKVECDLRNICGLYSVRQSMLKMYLEKEALGEESKPNIAHALALKNPKREISLCAKKLLEIKSALVESLKTDADHKSEAVNEMLTRARHYHNRIIRISSSPSVNEEFPPVLRFCEELIELLKDADRDEDKMNESILQLENLDTTKAKEVVDMVNSSTNNVLDARESVISSKNGIAENLDDHNDKIPNRIPLNEDYQLPNEFSNSTRKDPDIVDKLISMVNRYDLMSVNVPQGMGKVNERDSSQYVPTKSTNVGNILNQGMSQIELEDKNKIPLPNTNQQGPIQPSGLSNIISSVNTVAGQNVHDIRGTRLNEVKSHRDEEIKNLLAYLVSQKHNDVMSDNPLPTNRVPNIESNHNIPFQIQPSSHSIPIASSPKHDFVGSPYSLSSQNAYHSSAIHKWNLLFDGSREGLNVKRFLYRVESNASSYGIPDFKLLNDIQYLLKGKALNWFWAYKELNRPKSWGEFRAAMVRHFQDDRHDFDILQNIKDRKQTTNESFQDFFTSISEMTLALSKPLSDQELLHYLHGNMRRGLKQKLAGRRFNTSNELFDECVHIEHTWRQIPFVPEKLMDLVDTIQKSSSNCKPQQRTFPNAREIHEIDYEEVPNYNFPQNPVNSESIPYNEFLHSAPEVCAIGHTPVNTNQYVSKLIFPQSLFAKVKCWNCGDLGHFYYKCQKELTHIFCRGCGQSDILYEYFTKCQENSKRGVRTGEHTPQNPTPISQTTRLSLHKNQVNFQPKPQVEEAASNTDPEFYRLLAHDK